ncbi:uncharacterized protein LOC119462550 [Dermacentor silvarum]|uniref:uncharacterized protein LOC119462550 n=1 Tax=Dermacentor silvarum TaxID=543639 RepID=UPI00189BFA66|nr:uncharacterized protein LOC119462550 [Dermacentor silvarum]
MSFRTPGGRPPRAGHRRHASTSFLTLEPTTLQEFRAREELEYHAAHIADECLRKQATITLPADPALPVAVLGSNAAPAVVVDPPQASRLSLVQDTALAERVAAPLPSSDDDEDMDSSRSRKRPREAECEEDESACPRKQPPCSEAHVSPVAHSERTDDSSSVFRLPGQTVTTSSLPPAQDGARPETPALLTPTDARASPADSGDGELPPTSSATKDARHPIGSVPMVLADSTPPDSKLHGSVHQAAQFLKGSPRHTSAQQNQGKKRTKKQQKSKKSANTSEASSSRVAADPCHAPVTQVALKTVQHAAPGVQEPPSDGFELVRSKANRRHTRALENAALPVNPKVVGTVLFRPSAPGGAFRCAPRLVLAAALLARPGVAAVRVNNKRNIVAADTTTRACLEELMTVTELHGIPVTARPPAERGMSTGFLHGVDGEPADEDLLRAIESSVPVVSATRQGNTITIRFAGPVPPEHVSLFKLWFRERRVATIMASSTTALSRRAVRAAVREESNVEQAFAPPARSYAGLVRGAPAPSRRPVPTPRASRRRVPETAVASTTTPPDAPMPQTTVDQLVTNLLLTMQAVGSLLPAEHPLRAICLQAVAAQTTANHHG